MSNVDLTQPRPGHWYINRTGKLMKVKMVMLGNTGPEAVLIQYVEGSTITISMTDWDCLDLVVPRYNQGQVVLESEQSF